MAGLMIDGWGTNLMNVGNATGEIRNTTEKSMQFDLIWEHAQAATGPKCMLFTSSCSHLHGLTSFLCVPELCAMWSPLVCLLPSFLFSPKTVTVGVIGSHRYRDCSHFGARTARNTTRFVVDTTRQGNPTAPCRQCLLPPLKFFSSSIIATSTST